MHGSNVARRRIALDAVEYRAESMRLARYGILFRVASGASRIADGLATAERMRVHALRAAK